MHKPTAVLFDLDGTLLDSAPDFHYVINLMLAIEKKPPISLAAIKHQVSNGARAMISFAFDLEENQLGFDSYKNDFLNLYFIHLNKKSRLYQGVSELIHTLEKNQILWGIVTNKPERFTAPILEHFQLKSRAAVIICPDHVKRAKPDPEALYLACKKMSIASHNCWYVGDHLRDIQAGAAASMRTIGCTYGYLNSSEDYASWGADSIIDHPLQLIDLLQKN
ncbi:MAG: hypothetical protein OFPII_30880 [Osedax symbiont Rs1]|nr:MAG: hypothetical protein OFPII_30880 [Osedax symbiont Rs1]